MIERALDHDRPGERAFPDADTGDARASHAGAASAYGDGLPPDDNGALPPAAAAAAALSAAVSGAAAPASADAGNGAAFMPPSGQHPRPSRWHSGNASRPAAHMPDALSVMVQDWLNRAGIAAGRIDTISLQAALIGGIAYVALAWLSLTLTVSARPSARSGWPMPASWPC